MNSKEDKITSAAKKYVDENRMAESRLIDGISKTIYRSYIAGAAAAARIKDAEIERLKGELGVIGYTSAEGARIKKLHAEIDSLRAQLATRDDAGKRVNELVRSLKTQLSQAQETIADLRAERDEMRNAVGNLINTWTPFLDAELELQKIYNKYAPKVKP